MIVDQRILYSVLQIHTESGKATGFLMEKNHAVFLVTAAHCVKNSRNGDRVFVKRGVELIDYEVVEIGFSKKGVDCAVIKTEFQPRGGIRTDDIEKQTIQGHTYAYCGFPLGLEIRNIPGNFDFPGALVKQGVLSGWVDIEGVSYCLLDSYGNPGFSGAPVVWLSPKSKIRLIVGMVCGGYADNPQPVFRKTDDQNFRTETELFFQPQSGFVRFLEAKHFIEIIEEIEGNDHLSKPIERP